MNLGNVDYCLLMRYCISAGSYQRLGASLDHLGGRNRRFRQIMTNYTVQIAIYEAMSYEKVRSFPPSIHTDLGRV